MRVTILLVWFSFCVVVCPRRETHGQTIFLGGLLPSCVGETEDREAFRFFVSSISLH